MSTVLRVLVQQNILGVPVVRKGTGIYCGIIDVVDLVNYICEHFANYNFNTFQEFEAVYREVRGFQEATVEDLLLEHGYN